MPQTIAREDPVLTPPPNPSKPPEVPEGYLVPLVWISEGRTSEQVAATAVDITRWVTSRTDGDPEPVTKSARLVRLLEVTLDEVAAERYAAALRLAADMKALEDAGWKPETARAALAARVVPAPRKPAAA